MQFIEITLWGELSNAMGNQNDAPTAARLLVSISKTLQSCQRTIVSQSKECESLPDTLFIHDCKHFSWTGCRQARLLIRPLVRLNFSMSCKCSELRRLRFEASLKSCRALMRKYTIYVSLYGKRCVVIESALFISV